MPEYINNCLGVLKNGQRSWNDLKYWRHINIKGTYMKNHTNSYTFKVNCALIYLFNSELINCIRTLKPKHPPKSTTFLSTLTFICSWFRLYLFLRPQVCFAQRSFLILSQQACLLVYFERKWRAQSHPMSMSVAWWQLESRSLLSSLSKVQHIHTNLPIVFTMVLLNLMHCCSSIYVLRHRMVGTRLGWQRNSSTWTLIHSKIDCYNWYCFLSNSPMYHAITKRSHCTWK